MSGFGLSQIIKEPTHILGHTLDLMYLNKYQLIPIHLSVENDILDVRTDHYPVVLELPYPEVDDKQQLVNIRRTHNINVDNLKDTLLERLDSINFNCQFNDMYDKFATTCTEVVNQYAPVITKTVSTNKAPAWMDTEYRQFRAQRRKLEKIWRHEKNSSF